jgi:hypothetical protein
MSDSTIKDKVAVFAIPCFMNLSCELREPFVLVAVQTCRFQKSEATLGNSRQPIGNNERSKLPVVHAKNVVLQMTKTRQFKQDTSRHHVHVTEWTGNCLSWMEIWESYLVQLSGHCRSGLGEFQRHPTKIDRSRSNLQLTAATFIAAFAICMC